MRGFDFSSWQAIQQRRERENRRDLSVNPAHLRDVRMRPAPAPDATEVTGPESTDRSRRVRDAVEGALSDIILLGTDEQVQLASRAATELVEGRPVHTAELVVALRNFIRSVLDLDPIAASVAIPRQGPARPGTAKGNARGESDREARAGKAAGGDLAAGAGAGLGVGLGAGALAGEDRDPDHDHDQ